jgi:ribonuclease VapC
MIADTSALVAIVRAEPDAARYAAALAASGTNRLSAATYVEAAIVVDSGRDAIASRRFDDLLTASRLVIESLTAVQAEVARAAYRDFGKGSGHPARLNFCDCLSYALARTMGEPLLYKGDDFGHTDITPALPIEDEDGR